ncbi:hypothetical protein PVAP13_2NG001827 [Panicum virgatum]|uniref:Uncharacterized protein n=1 Tax=Panicum virgatum TaxID=38727 RepID=A0A8T0V3I0_PANVG|nr:hypothetical protein PVAP13_2NG001827 [Panicum virgatum]
MAVCWPVLCFLFFLCRSFEPAATYILYLYLPNFCLYWTRLFFYVMLNLCHELYPIHVTIVAN